MMVGAVEVLTVVWNVIQRSRGRRQHAGIGPSTAFAGATALVVLVILGWMFQVLPLDGTTRSPHGDKAVYAWGPFRATETNADALGDGWARYNFAGYEGRKEYYTEYEGVVRTMERLGNDPAHGCGRAMWENNEDNGKYGTTMALMLLPHWTDGCIGSMEGLFFEASGTTPYHFLTVAVDVEAIVEPGARAALREHQRRHRRARDAGARCALRDGAHTGGEDTGGRPSPSSCSSGRPDRGTSTRSPTRWWSSRLTVQPVVVRGRPGDARERNLELGTSWFQTPGRVGGDAGRRRSRRVAADLRAGRSRAPRGRARRLRTQGRHRRAGRTDRAGGAAAGRGVRSSRSSSSRCRSPSIRPACRCSSRSATSRTGRPRVHWARIASDRT